jgi:hypothetical protein
LKSQRKLEMIQTERENQEAHTFQAKIEMNKIENEIEIKKNEIAEKRANDLADTFLKIKEMRVKEKTIH